MRVVLFVLVISTCIAATAQKNAFPRMYASYTHPKMDSIVAAHRSIAFLVEYTYLTRRVDEKSVIECDSILKNGLRLARHFVATLKKDKRTLMVNVQHPDSTYQVLARRGIEPSETSMYDREALAAVLGVDAVVTMRYLVLKKYNPAEAHLINIASVVGTFGMAAQGFYTASFPIVAGTEIFYEYTTIHAHTGELIYLEKSIDTAMPSMTPGRFKHEDTMPDFPYLKN